MAERTSTIVPPAPPLEAVTFDLDGLLFNTEELYQEVGGHILARRGKQFTDELIDMMMGRKSNVAYGLMIEYHQLDATPEQLAAEAAEIFGGILPEKLRPMPGLLDLLDALEAAGIPKGIATSSGRGFVELVLGISKLGPRFSFVLTSEDIEHGKPAPDVYLLAAARHQVRPQRMMVLEDSHIGCAAAVAAEAYAVAVPHGRSLQHQFPGARFVANTLADRRIYQALRLSGGDTC
ncbi:MAG: HAD family phosphatase [Planctomycetota bacterium]|nr:MAG: HAD family phosphatase [Planctomycetota bacterium]